MINQALAQISSSVNALGFSLREVLNPIASKLQNVSAIITLTCDQLNKKSKDYKYRKTLTFMDESLPNHSPEIKAACIIWMWCYLNGYLQNNNAELLKMVLRKFYPEFKSIEDRIIKIIRSYPGINRKFRVSLDLIHVDSKEEVEEHIKNHVISGKFPPFMDHNEKFHCKQLMAAISLFDYQSFEKRSLTEMNNFLLNMKDVFSIKARNRIIVMVRSRK